MAKIEPTSRTLDIKDAPRDIANIIDKKCKGVVRHLTDFWDNQRIASQASINRRRRSSQAINRRSDGLLIPHLIGPRPCEPCDVCANLIQLKSGVHSPRLHSRMLSYVSVGLGNASSCNLRFSPVWLYICVCKELGRVNRLSQTLHLCFFCVLDETLELN